MRRVSTKTPASDASFSDRGSALVTGTDGRVRIVSRDGDVRLVAGVEDADRATISADGTLALVIGKGGVRLLDLPSGRVRETYPHPGAESAAISFDNRRVVTGGADQRLLVWSGQSGRRIHSLIGQFGHPTEIAFSPDGTLVASASSDGIARVWRTSDWGLQSVLPGGENALTGIAFGADSEQVVTSGRDGTARVFDAKTGSHLFTLTGHDDWVTSAAFTGGVGSSVVTSSLDGTVRLWDAVFQPLLEELADVGAPVVSVAFGDDGRLRVGDDRQAHTCARSHDGRRVERRARRHLAPARGGPGWVGRDHSGQEVILRSAGRRTVLRGFRDRVTSVSFSRFGGLLATASIDHDVRVWNVATGKRVRLYQARTAVHDAQFSQDGRWLISAANKAALWDLGTDGGEPILRLRGHAGTTTAATFDPSGRRIVTGGVDGTVRTYACDICGGIDHLLTLAGQRLAATRRELTAEEREQYLR